MRLAIVVALSLLWAASAHAATVAIVRPLGSSPALNETLTRLHGELLSLGLEVELADRPSARELGTSSLRAWLEDLAATRGVDAVLDIVGDVVPLAVDVWVMQKSPRRLEVSRVTVEPGTESATERLAIRAIEVLRSNLLEIDLAAKARHDAAMAKPPAPTLPQVEVREPASHPERVGIEAGAAVLTGLDGVGSAILPILRFDWAALPWLVVQAAWAGPGSRPTVATTVGDARVAQQFGILGGGYRFRAEQRLRPFLALSAGVLRTSVAGEADLPKQGHSVVRWSFLAEGSLGVELKLHDGYFVALAAHAQVAAPYVAIHFVDTVVATSGRPNLLLTLTVGAWL